MKRLVFTLALSLLLGCAASEEYVRSGTDFQIYERVAVLPLADFPTHPGSGIQVADLLSFEFLKHGIAVVDRSQTQMILAEQDFGVLGIIDSSTAPNVGRLLGVRGFITGSINEWSSTIVDIQMVQGADPAYMPISAAGFSSGTDSLS